MQLAQELYDPAGRLTSEAALAGRFEEFAGFVLNLYGVDFEAAPELLPSLACDAVESGIDEEELTARARVFGAAELVAPSLQEVIGRARQQATDLLQTIGIKEVPEDKRTVVAADSIARASYADKTRKSNDPYYTHPKRAAAMGLHILNRLEKEGYTIEPEFKDAVISTALLHDATEETIRSCKYYDPSRPEGFSPLLVREVFRQTGNPHGRIVANSLRLMTHYAKQPWAPDYRTYVMLGSSDFIFNLVKPLDMYDNLRIDPKPATRPGDEDKIRDKQALYEACIEMLSINAPRHTDNSLNKVWARRYFDILRSIEPADLPKMVETLDAYIYTNQSEPADTNTVRFAA
jgi:hypothetical protein